MRKNFAFIHIPKTAGTYIYYSLIKPNGIRYLSHHFPTDRETVKWLGKYTIDKSRYDYLASIRNPFDQLCSYFYHDQRNWSHLEYFGWGDCRKDHNFKDFNEFVDFYLDPKQEFNLPEHKKNLWASAYDRDGNFVPKYLFRFENIENDLVSFASKFNLRLEKTENKFKSKRRFASYRQEYNLEQVKKLEKLWTPYLKQFNYKF